MGTKPQSMTGFGSAEIARDGVTCRCDIRSVNGKGLDIKLRLPNGLEALEQPIKKAVAARVTRGNLQLFLAIERGGQAVSAISIDKDLFRTLVAESTALAADTGIAPPTADAILAMRGVVTTDEASGKLDVSDEATAQFVMSAAEAALEACVSARETEGAALAAILRGHVDTLENLTTRALSEPASQANAIKARLETQIEDLLGQADSLDPQRLAAEAALLATRADTREETDRLIAHIANARALLDEGGTIGRRLDFLTQELNREANTLCSKSASQALTDIGLEMKATVDQLREQVQNLQ